GQELLTLLVLITEEKINWVAWTPEGYYAVSSGAWNWLQWHLNHGLDAQGTAVHVSRVPRLYRPEALALVLQKGGIGAVGLDEAKAARAEIQRVTASSAPPGARLHVLAIGVSSYEATSLNLKYAHKDALDLVRVIFATQDLTGPFQGSGGLYAEVNPVPL